MKTNWQNIISDDGNETIQRFKLLSFDAIICLFSTSSALFLYQADYIYINQDMAQLFSKYLFIGSFFFLLLGLTKFWFNIAIQTNISKYISSFAASIIVSTVVYSIGFDINPLGSTLFILGGFLLIFLLGSRALISATIGSLIVLTLFSYLESKGTIQYAPLLNGPPVKNGELYLSWRTTIGLCAFLWCGVSVYLFYKVFTSWKSNQQELAKSTEIMSRYLPEQLYKGIMQGEKSLTDSSSRQKITVIFTDIVGFTEIADILEPEELTNILDRYFSLVAKLASKYSVTVDKFLGDGVMMFIGAPEKLDPKEQANRAIKLAIEIQQDFARLSSELFEEGIEFPLDIRIGINTGVANVGSFGPDERKDFTAIGGQVNLASRLQSFGDKGSVVVSHSTYSLIKDDFEFQTLSSITLKGFRHPVRVYQLLHSDQYKISA
jgi:class 3 adenylate cyclase